MSIFNDTVCALTLIQPGRKNIDRKRNGYGRIYSIKLNCLYSLCNRSTANDVYYLAWIHDIRNIKEHVLPNRPCCRSVCVVRHQFVCSMQSPNGKCGSVHWMCFEITVVMRWKMPIISNNSTLMPRHWMWLNRIWRFIISTFCVSARIRAAFAAFCD